MNNRITTQDRTWSRKEVLELLELQRFMCYTRSGGNDNVLKTELIKLK